MITIEVIQTDNPAVWEAYVNDQLITRSKIPFFAAARELQSSGTPDDTPIQLTHRGSGLISIYSTVGVAAALSVHNEPRCRFTRFTHSAAQHD